MKQLGRFWINLTASGCALLTACAVSAGSGNATVQAIPSGTAQFTAEGANWQALEVGAVVNEGSTIKTDAAGVVDLYLGANGPLLQITEASIVQLVALKQLPGAGEDLVTTKVKVTKGKVIGLVRKLGAASEYVVVTANGSFKVNGARFAASATGEFTILDGAATVLYTQPGQDKATQYALNAGETFQPKAANGQGAVLVTSADLASEVALQLDRMLIRVDNPVAKHWAPTAQWLQVPRPVDASAGENSPPWQLPPVEEPTTTPTIR